MMSFTEYNAVKGDFCSGDDLWEEKSFCENVFYSFDTRH
jgi:hypothetical protein